MSAPRRRARTAPPAPPAPPAPARSGRGPWLGALAAALGTAALHAPTLGFGFVWDDARLIVHNAGLRSVAGLLDALRSDFWITSGPAASGFWRPLVTLTYAVDRAWSGGAAWGFHVTNVLAAAGASALVVLLAARLGAGALAAAFAGLWFAAMPAHVESVAWIAGRTDVLSTLFVLLALVLDRRARAAGRGWPGVTALAAGAAALLAKESALLLPGFVAALDRCDPSGPRRGTLRWTLPWLGLTGAYALAHAALVPAAPPPAYLDAATIERGRLASALALGQYLGFLTPFVPHTPATLLPSPSGFGDPRVLAGLALHVALAGALGWALLRRSPWAVALALFWGGLAPVFVANVFQAYLLHSERFLHLPSAGAACALALGLERARRPRALAWGARALAAALVLASAAATWRTLPDWSSDESLFESMTRKGPRNVQGWIQLARLRLTQGRPADGERALAEAVRLSPARPEVLSLRALVHYRRGEWPQVIALADSALALDPTLPEPRLQRATALLRTGQLDAAAEELVLLRARMPEHATVLGLEGQRLVMLRRDADALPLLQRSAADAPDDPDVMYGLGMAHARLSHVAEARAAFERAVRLEPGFYEAWLRLAMAAHLSGDAAARDEALARAAALPDAADGRVRELARRFATLDATRGGLNP